MSSLAASLSARRIRPPPAASRCACAGTTTPPRPPTASPGLGLDLGRRRPRIADGRPSPRPSSSSTWAGRAFAGFEARDEERRRDRRTHVESSASWVSGRRGASSGAAGWDPFACHDDRRPSSPVIRRSSSSSSSITEQITSNLPALPEPLSHLTLWGGTGFLLLNFHAHLHLPYWACISLTNVCLRSAMIPVAIRGAKTAVKFGTVAPEVQFLVSSFANDMKRLNAAKAMAQEGSFAARQALSGQSRVIGATLGSLRGLFKLNGVNLLDLFKSPMLQIPFFWYFAVDLRKIIEGSDPALAQQLVDSSFWYLTDLTEPDPWYGLPIATGLLLYLNVETAVGRKALSGETSSQSNFARLLKDAFQSLAIFMPCFMAQQPSGVQLYLATSMVFTLLQSKAMRNDAVRAAVGLPPADAKPPLQGELVKDFLEVMAARQAAKARGGFVLGEGVHLTGANVSGFRTGSKRKSSIVVEKKDEEEAVSGAQAIKVEFEVPDYTLRTFLVFPDLFKSSTPVPFLPGAREPVFHTSHDAARVAMEGGLSAPASPLMPHISPSVMEAKLMKREALGIRERTKKQSGPITVDKLKSKRKKGKQGKKKR